MSAARREGGLGAATLAAIERASESDRVYFEEHLGADCYLRPRVPGEMGPFEDECSPADFPFMRVTQIRPGLRTREPCAHLEILSMS